MKTGIELITEERKRQIEKEGWTPEHDAEHTLGEIALAAATYALPEEVRYPNHLWVTDRDELWPWDMDFWKPSPENRVRELQKAGALIAAEIDRLNQIKK